MKYTFDETNPYEFKDLTGLEEKYKIGISIIEDEKIIGGIAYQVDTIPFPLFDPEPRVISILGMEILPEYRNQGKGTAIINEFLEKYDCVHAAVQEEKAWEWWKKMRSQVYLAILYPGDKDKADPRAHTLVFVIGRDENKTMIFKRLFQYITAQKEEAVARTTFPKIDFSGNKH